MTGGTPSHQARYNATVDGLRQAGYSKEDAIAEADYRTAKWLPPDAPKPTPDGDATREWWITARAMRRDGATLDAIAAALGRSRTAVSYATNDASRAKGYAYGRAYRKNKRAVNAQTGEGTR